MTTVAPDTTHVLDPLGAGDAQLARTPWQIFWGSFKKDKVAVAGRVFLITTTLAFDLVGDALRDALDRRSGR